MSPPVNLTILISGDGSNLQSLIDATNSPRLPNARIIHVVSNRRNAYGLTRAQNARIPTTIHNLISDGYTKRYPSQDGQTSQVAREHYDAAVATLILKNDPPTDIVIMAGWMHIVTPFFLDPLRDAGIKIINLHPALPGSYVGANALDRAWEDWLAGRITKTGAMIHRVIADVDKGAPIATKEIEFEVGEIKDNLEGRFHEMEHALIVDGARLIVEEVVRERAGSSKLP